MKKFKLMLALAVVLGAGSAFTNMKDEPKEVLATVYWQHSDNVYTLEQPTASCSLSSSAPCSISYVEDPDVESFIYSERPMTARTESPTTGKGTN